MDEQSRPADAPNLPRFHFHVTLALIIFPLGAVIGGWTLAIIDVLKGYSNRAQLTWTRLLVALVVIDALVLGSLIYLFAHLEEFQSKAAEEKRARIGLAFEGADGLQVREAAPDLPGARAGVRAGDVIEKIDAIPVATPQALQAELEKEKPGTPRTLTVRRAGSTLDLRVTPEVATPPGRRGLFESEPTPEFRVYDEMVVAQLPAFALIGILAVWGRFRRSPSVPVWGGFVLALVGSLGGSVGFLVLARDRLGGLSLELFLVSILIQTVLMLGLTAAAGTWLSREASPVAPTMAPLRAGLQGFFYLLTGIPRSWCLLVVAAHLLFPDKLMGDPMVAMLSEAHFGVLGGAMLILGIAILGPLAEEYLFRGYLLPRLVVQWGELPGLFACSLLFTLLHLRDGPFVPMIFLYGWIFGWVRLRSGTIAASTALHIAVNSTAAAVILMRG
ncbi:MAG TPA: CPBP family glutamic-type intramembrane protease [Planctomycetota bacterium]|nr:CPBP family glutamic-type intramembrane protease [Planctomycetota bacterium]